MSKQELRRLLLEESSVAGNADFELKQLKKLQSNEQPADAYTITVTCSEVFTLICC